MVIFMAGPFMVVSEKTPLLLSFPFYTDNTVLSISDQHRAGNGDIHGWAIHGGNGTGKGDAVFFLDNSCGF